VNTVILSAVENCAGVISACLPTMLPIGRFLRHGRFQGHQLQSIFGSSSKQPVSIKLSAFKKTLRFSDKERERRQGRPGGPFKKLLDATSKPLPAIDISGPNDTGGHGLYGTNGITITTDLEQTREALDKPTAA